MLDATMAILPIRLLGDPVLREPGRPVTEFGPDLDRLVDDMVETMRAAGGAGLAAPQVGVQRRLFVYDTGDGPVVVVNPELADPEGSSRYEEGCLSLPGIYVDIERPESVTARWQDPSGARHEIRADGFLARVLQHEMDHVDGRIFIDRAERKERKEALRQLREVLEPGRTSYLPRPRVGATDEHTL